MFLAYLDESGNTGRKLDDPDQLVHGLVAVLVPEEEVLPLAKALDEVVVDHVPDSPDRELHGSELFGGSGAWKGVLPDTRLAVYQEALSLLRTHDCSIAHASIHKQRLSTWKIDSAPHFLALHFLSEKIEGFVRRQDEPSKQRALLVADETNEHESFSISLLKDLQRRGVGVFRGVQIARIIDTVHFVRSETNEVCNSPTSSPTASAGSTTVAGSPIDPGTEPSRPCSATR